MTWLLVVSDVPGGGFERPDLPPGTGKMVVLGVLVLAAWVVQQTGAVNLRTFRSPLPLHRLRRRAYRVAQESGLHDGPVGADKGDRYAINAHQRQVVKELRRDGRYTAYALLRHKEGLDMSKGSKDRAKFEAKWRHAMTRPDEHGNPAHDWIFQPYTGTNTVAVRWAPLTPPEVVRLFEQLQPTFKWPEGTRPAEVIHASTDKETA